MEDKLARYIQDWNLSDARLLAETPGSHVYTVAAAGEKTVLKILTAYGADEASGAIALRCFGGQGAIRVLRHDSGAQLLEYAPGEDLRALVARGEDERAAAIIGDVLNTLHNAHRGGHPPELRSLRSWFGALFEKGGRDEAAGQATLYTKAAAAAENLLSAPLKTCILHGDIHHENIRHSPRGWLAIDPKGLVGEPAYDAANTLFNPLGMNDLVENETRLLRTADILAAKLVVPASRILTFAFIHACLSNSWALEEGQPFDKRTLAIARITEPHIIL